MTARHSILPLLLLFMSVSTVAAQPYKLKLSRPWNAGQKFSLVTWTESRQTMSMTSGAEMIMHQDSLVKIYLLADGEVLDAEPAQVRYEILKCLKFIGGDTIEVVPSGTQVIQRIDEKEFVPVTGTLPEQVLEDIGNAIGRFNTAQADENFGTGKPQFVGGSWDINISKAVSDLNEKGGFEVSDRDVTGRATLIGLSTVREIPTYKVRVDLDLKNVNIPGIEAFNKRNVAAIVQFEGQYPLDETMGIVKAQLTMTMDVDASGPVQPGGPDVVLHGRLTQSQTAELTYQ